MIYAKVLPLLLIGITFPSRTSTQFEADTDTDDNVDNSDVPTNLGLSPWELFVLGDLVFRLIPKQCPKLNPDVLTSFKEQFVDALKSVPKNDVQNDDFLPAYSHLVQCMDYVMMKKGEIDMDEERMKIVDAEGEANNQEQAESSEQDWQVKDPTTPKPSTEAPKTVERGLLGSISKWFWNLSPLRILFTDTATHSIDLVKASEDMKAVEVKKDARQEQKQKHLAIYHRARQNVAKFFHEASELVQRTCPIIHRPDKVFTRQALLDMTTWLTLEHHVAIVISNEYFEKQKLLQEITECNKVK